MVFVPVTVLGGLPVIADVWFDCDYEGNYDAGCDGLYWIKRDGSKGAPLSQKVMDRVESGDYWDAYVTEQANDWLSVNCPTVYSDGREEGDWSPEYLLLNPR